jgi:hypothetical protein
MKDHGLTGLQAQLFARARRGARLAQDLALRVGHLIAADDDCFRPVCRDFLSFGPGQPARQGIAGLIRAARFVDLRRPCCKGQSKLLQQLPAPDGTGGQDELRTLISHCHSSTKNWGE